MVTTLFITFSGAQGQLTPMIVMEACQNSNPSELLWLVLLSARIKRIHPKMKVLEWSQHFSHYKSVGIFPDAQRQLTRKSHVQSCRILNPFKILWVSLLPARIKKIQSTSSPLGNDRSPKSQHNVWRHHDLRCSEAGNAELETVTRN